MTTFRAELQLDGKTATGLTVPPEDLAAALSTDAASRAYFDILSFSHQHAYVSWIEQAKRPETRRSRVSQTLALLAERRPTR